MKKAKQGVIRFQVFPWMAVAFLIAVMPVQAQVPGATHTVEPGETLYSIARQFDVAVSDLRGWNSLQSDDLSPGQTLRTGPAESADAVTHTVVAGETLYSLSRRYNVTIAEIERWNSLESGLVNVGQRLIIYTDETPDTSGPVSQPQAGADREIPETSVDETPPTQQNRYHTVRSGETLTGIARQYGMSLEDLRGLNSLSSDLLRVGQQLTVRPVISTPVVDERDSESSPQGRFVSYQVQSGESVQDLLERYNMTLEEFRALNPEVNSSSPGSGRYVTVLLPPTRNFSNPYRNQESLQDLGRVPVLRYEDNHESAPTTSGELYNPETLTAAHPNMTIGQVIYVENPSNGRGTYVRINDRFSGDGIRLSHKAIDILGYSSVDRATATLYLDER